MTTTRPAEGLKPARRVPWTDMPAGLMAVLVAAGVPRTVLADLNVVPPESGPLYYLLALAPYGCWVAVAVLRRTRKPLADFVVLGMLYGLSLLIVHQLLWGAEGHTVPQSARDIAAHFSPGLQELALRVYTSGIALIIGIGSGLIIGLLALTVHTWRARRGARPTAPPTDRQA